MVKKIIISFLLLLLLAGCFIITVRKDYTVKKETQIELELFEGE